jgi:hypothetical protein
VARLVQGDRTRFLSQGYTIPFAPLTQPLSFDDATSWPKDPMQVFSQWSGDNDGNTAENEGIWKSAVLFECSLA